MGPEQATSPVVGALFATRYEILAELGRGGMGIVYKARDRTLDEVVALKVLRADVTQTPELEARFVSEIKLARRVTHRNVCRIHEYGEASGLRYISMAFVDGVDLKHVIATRGALPTSEAFEICIQVAEGLAAIHDEGIVHRDLKTSNVMLDGRRIARLMDFGIAKAVGVQATQGLTGTGAIIGTPEYMSPEQALGRKVDLRSDVYSLGVVLFEVFTGRIPFQGDTPVATILQHIQQPPPLDGPLAAAVPPSVVPLLRRALAKDPAERPQTAREVAETLREAQRSAAPTVVPPSTQTEVVAATARGPAPAPGRAPLVFATVGAAILVALGSGVLWLALRSARRTPAEVPAPPATPAQVSVPATSSAAPSPPASQPSPATPPPSIRSSSATPAARPAQPLPPPSPTQPTASSTTTPGFLVVIAVPWADVSVDGRAVATVPMRKLPLDPGEHTVRFEHPDYRPLQRRVTIKSGEVVNLAVDMPEEAVRKR